MHTGIEPDSQFTGDEDIQRLYAALSWEAGGRRKRFGVVGSMVVHGAAFLAVLLGSIPLPTAPTQPPPAMVTTLVFVAKTSSSPPRDSPAPASLQIPSGASPPDDSDGVSADLKVELTGISLAFERDVPNYLPELVKKNNGSLALLQKGDLDFAEYLFNGPDWKLVRGPVSIRENYVVLMNPAEDWNIFGELERQNGIQPGKFQGAAVFDIGYRNCVKEAIREGAISSHKAGRVISAQLKFTLEDPCGLIALGVELAPKTAH